jgi:hypothetical protein
VGDGNMRYFVENYGIHLQKGLKIVFGGCGMPFLRSSLSKTTQSSEKLMVFGIKKPKSSIIENLA